jgi:hypothetical protein
LDAATLTAAREAVAGCVAALVWESEQAQRPGDQLDQPGYVDAQLEKASRRLAELDARLDAMRASNLDREPIRSDAAFLSGEVIDGPLARPTQHAMDLVLDVLERDAGDARAAEHAEIDRSGIDAGSPDDPERPDTIYQRYPDLSRDDGETQHDRDDGRSR